MLKTKSLLAAAAVAGFLTGTTATTVHAGVLADGHSPTPISGEKKSCSGKDGCSGKDSCKGHKEDKKDKSSCSGKDGCSGKKDQKDKKDKDSCSGKSGCPGKKDH